MKIKHTAVVSGTVLVLALAGAGTASAGSSGGRCPEAKACSAPPKEKGAGKSSAVRSQIVPALARDPWGREVFRSGDWFME